MYIIPEELIREFRRVSANNCSEDGGHIETLGFLIGYKSNDNLVGTDLIFPEQEATCSRVVDNGKYSFISSQLFQTIELTNCNIVILLLRR